MSDPNPNIPDHDPAHPPAAAAGRKSAAPLLWLVLLLALLAFGWFIYNQRAGESLQPEVLPPPAVDVGDARDAAAERERAADDARRRDLEPEAAPPPPPARDAGPELVNRVQPEYPASAYRGREEGTVLLGLLVDVDGQVAAVDVVNRSGHRALDRAAMDAVEQWTFKPAVRDGAKVEGRVEVPITFRLEEAQ